MTGKLRNNPAPMLNPQLKPSVARRLEDLARRTGRTPAYEAARAVQEKPPVFGKEGQEAKAPDRDPGRIQQAITALKDLRRGVIKPGGMTVREMIDCGRTS
ncbi:MAG: hypothetical protein EOP86_12720 [Verrucomicrobiaceae bacterium]|nr:MAG: hypothetical protein EOP86_12720 [Verrucomicrobiaceae bacterium]